MVYTIQHSTALTLLVVGHQIVHISTYCTVTGTYSTHPHTPPDTDRQTDRHTTPYSTRCSRPCKSPQTAGPSPFAPVSVSQRRALWLATPAKLLVARATSIVLFPFPSQNTHAWSRAAPGWTSQGPRGVRSRWLARFLRIPIQALTVLGPNHLSLSGGNEGGKMLDTGPIDKQPARIRWSRSTEA